MFSDKVVSQTFSFMILEGYKIFDHSEGNEYLEKKVELIVDMTSSSRLLGKDFWDCLLTKEISDIEKFSESGFACRLIITLGDKELEPDEEIKVAGEKLIPLIFALEVENTELLKLLCKNGANTNITNKKGDSALEVAIDNENDNQIDILLSHGAEAKSKKEKDYVESLSEEE